MARPKKGNWKPDEVKELIKIQKGATANDRLKALAAKWNRDFSNLKAKWSYELNKENGPDTGNEDWDTPMEFTIDKKIKVPTRRYDSVDVVRMKAGLDLVYPKLEANKGNIPIPNALAGQAKRYLNTAYPEAPSIFTMVKEKGKPTGITRIFKKRRL